MITPKFSCTQTERLVIVSLYCPSVRAADVEIHVENTLVSIHVNPYFLRLNLSQSVLEDDESSASYDPSSGYLTVTLTKEVQGQTFDDLDLLAKLLAPRSSKRAPVIEVVSDTPGDTNEIESVLVERTRELSLDSERKEILAAAENDWQLAQQIPSDQQPLNLSTQQHYGFLNLHSHYFIHVAHTENEVNELGDEAETCKPEQRRKRRVEHEDRKFDPEYYMADYADDEQIRELLHWNQPHVTSDEFQWTKQENAAVLRLPRKEYIPAPAQTHQLYLTLLTLLFSYAYETRTTQHDPTSESAWTIGALTPAFSALDPPTPEGDGDHFTTEELVRTVLPSYRRSLAFPLYRSFELAETCRKDAAEILCKGKRTVVRCLLEMKDILDHHEVYYVYSKIWLDDYCVWTQTQASDEVLAKLGQSVKAIQLPKTMIGWDLEALEAATRGQREREPDSDDED